MSKLFLCDKKHLINNTRKRFFWLLLVPVFFVAFPSSGITNNALSSYIGSNSYAYSYDGIGNRTSATENNAVTTYTSNLVNQYTLINAIAPTYDADGNMTNYNGWTYTYNGENRLIVAENAASGVRVEADYDYMGRRIFKKVYNNNTLTKHSVFIYDGFKQIAEFDVLNNNSLKASYLWQPVGLDVVLLRNSEYLIADGNKNIIQIRNATGNVTDSYVYDPFGKVTHNGGSENPFQFSSEFFDSETRLVYYNYRYYSPNLGRWINRDPIEEDGGLNLYVVCKNNLMTQWDNLGFHIASDLKMAQNELRNRKRGFLCWHTEEKKDLSWVDKLTRCPKQLRPIYVKAPIAESFEYQLENANPYRQPSIWPSTFNKLVDFGNPDESEWVFAKRYSLNYEGIKFTAVAWYYHPGSAYELRTKNPEKYNNSGNQCIYDKKGTLCTNIPTAGTADKISPNFSPGQHHNIDVVPFVLAKGLGFSYVEKYYEVRPIW